MYHWVPLAPLIFSLPSSPLLLVPPPFLPSAPFKFLPLFSLLPLPSSPLPPSFPPSSPLPSSPSHFPPCFRKQHERLQAVILRVLRPTSAPQQGQPAPEADGSLETDVPTSRQCHHLGQTGMTRTDYIARVQGLLAALRFGA